MIHHVRKRFLNSSIASRNPVHLLTVSRKHIVSYRKSQTVPTLLNNVSGLRTHYHLLLTKHVGDKLTKKNLSDVWSQNRLFGGWGAQLWVRISSCHLLGEPHCSRTSRCASHVSSNDAVPPQTQSQQGSVESHGFACGVEWNESHQNKIKTSANTEIHRMQKECIT